MVVKSRARLACAVLAASAAMLVSTAQAASPQGNVILPVPQRSQFDGTKWAASDCGPTSLGMILASLGDTTPTFKLRERANQLMNNYDPDNGTRIQDLQAIAQEHSFTVNGPSDGGNLGHWIPAELRAELRAGRPVLIETALFYLPNHWQNPYVSDHFIVLVGTDGEDFIFNDPADAKAPGYRQRMTEAQLLQAWGKAKRPFLGFSIGRGGSGQVLPAATLRDPLASPAVVVPLHEDKLVIEAPVAAAAPESPPLVAAPEVPSTVLTPAGTIAADRDGSIGQSILRLILSLVPSKL